MTAYYEPISRETQEDGTEIAYYKPTIHAQGAWQPHEQHMAPATGILCYELENFQPRDNMQIGRISLEILGVIYLDEIKITTRLIRPGRTIELIESTMEAQGKTCISARTWRMVTSDSSAVLGLEDQAIPSPDDESLKPQHLEWAGGFISSVYGKSGDNKPGRGIAWLNSDLNMVQGSVTSDFVHAMGLVDSANGLVPRERIGQSDWIFPNLDLQIHLYRMPKGRWLGFDIRQQFGSEGIGLTSAVLHDEQGPFGRTEQILTIRHNPQSK